MVVLEHIALECDTVDHAKMLYEDVFACSFVKSFDLPKDFVEQVFSVNKEIKALVYKAETGIYEVFITGKKSIPNSFSHVCISVDDMKDFSVRCDAIGLKPYTVQKNKKSYWFVRDMIGNLFEVKEK
jgi:catechol 2,3-dioxygenase-like lactoylglutathione lyase family enzyme